MEEVAKTKLSVHHTPPPNRLGAQPLEPLEPLAPPAAGLQLRHPGVQLGQGLRGRGRLTRPWGKKMRADNTSKAKKEANQQFFANRKPEKTSPGDVQSPRSLL